VHLGHHSDAELMKLAKAGWAPAFAVLVHRHAPVVHAALRDDHDPLSATTAVFVHAMRELRQRDATAPLAPWLLELIDRPPPAQPSALSDEELDAIWLELDHRWPDGERPATTWPWRRLATVAALVVVAAVVPALVLGIDTPAAEDVELRAVPVTDEAPPVQTPDDDALPSFSFPVAPDGDSNVAPEEEAAEPETAPETEPAPTEAPPEPTPEPTPPPAEPAPAPAPEPAPTAEEEPQSGGEDGGVLDPVLGDDDADDASDNGGEGESAGSGDASEVE
jgi:hypothetical protein